MNSPRVSIIVAIDKNRGIGFENKIPWHLSADLKRFKELTLGHPVILGRKTFESIIGYLGKPLPGRTNIIITRDPNFAFEGCLITKSLDEAIQKASELDTEEIYICGGASIYEQAIDKADRIYLTIIDKNFEADTHFPDYSEFKHVVSEEKHAENELEYSWITLDR